MKKTTLTWHLALFFCVLQFAMQMILNTMVPQIMHAYHLGPAQMGFLGSLLFYSLVLMQLPCGWLLDAQPFNRVMGYAALCCGLGSLLFIASTHFWFAALARILTGIGCAFGFVGIIKYSGLAFPGRLFPLLVSLAEIGCFCVSAFVTFFSTELTNVLSWKASLLGLGILCLLSAFFNFYSIENPKQTYTAQNPLHLIVEFLSYLNNKTVWCTCLFCAGLFSILTVFCALWGMPVLSTLYHISATKASFGLVMIFVGSSLGCGLIGIYLYKDFDPLKLMTIGAFLTLVLAILLFETNTIHSNAALDVGLFLFGFVSSSFLCAYTVISRLFPMHLLGLGSSLCNMFVMGSPIILQPVIGLLLSWHHHTNGHELAHFAIADYRRALWGLIAAFAVSFISSLFIKPPKTAT